MKNIRFLLLPCILTAQPLLAQLAGSPVSAIRSSAVSYGPLALSVNGKGEVFPFRDGEMLPVGDRFLMLAIPAPGYAFANWELATVFTFTQYTVGQTGNIETSTSTVWSPASDYDNSPLLEFSVQPGPVLLDNPGVVTITESQGWVANFVPIKR